ncbi:IF-2B-domain-containing protein [Rhizodiscina lignyota]|uniref:Translation initiation factor eIF2B subunit delta n=1 Tax=Rhizodiscina lignyota TaxID=1504668 RepID=A0A9P4IRF4_9PEZI|nr:IF-2B-domain-containing protein [Rhizodiscina lignyota]
MSTESANSVPNGTPNTAAEPNQTNGTAQPPEKKLTGAELKKQKQAEKQARRAQAKESPGAQASQKPPSTPSKPQQSSSKSPKSQQGKNAPEKQQQQQSPKAQQQGAKVRRSSETAMAPKPALVKRVGLFGHLYGQPRRHNTVNAGKDIHPAVLALGLQMSSYEICGSNARCVAMLLAFKSVIHSYTTPPGTSLARHLTSHHLSPQIDYLKSCRPISISMGNAIRWLKDLIIKIDPDVPESEAKQSLIAAIDSFIRERITAADTLISQTASSKIRDGDVILTFAKSSIVLQTLLEAHANGTKFRVIVVDSKPLFEGRKLAEELVEHGLDVQYNLISAAAHAVKEASKVFVGAHAMMGNGRLYSRVGTAIIAMLAHDRDIPVIVCCESVKFTERVALDSIVGNEVAPAEELLARGEEGEGQIKRWQETPNLQLLNVMYDVTPAEYIKMVVTEYGSLPPSSVPAVLRNLGTI